MENIKLTKAEQNLLNTVNKHGGIAAYKHWIAYNVPDRRYRFTYLKNLEKLIKKLQANNVLKLMMHP